MERMVEICCGSYQDGIEAYNGGASRIELNRALSVGGLSASVVDLSRLKKETDLQIICMVRCRAAGFCYDEVEISLMMEEAQLLLECGADGIAFGFLNEDGSINKKALIQMTNLIHSYKATAVFHRAIDVCQNIDESMHVLIDCGVDRVLTSGQKKKATEAIDMLTHLQSAYGDSIEILAGSGINVDNALDVMDQTGIKQVHSSCKGYKRDMTTKAGDVSFAYLENEHALDHDIVNYSLVKELVDLVEVE